ncbi:MAG: efflux RND transporter permease subunit [Cyclobacteriaceae bacterium]|nr:efflux RND transporter permease subunit [Cyclobacteriaceae bacterium]MCH8517139.1 efflux RND transporter permease subunit [Cyclobacteriaceae bacterium]
MSEAPNSGQEKSKNPIIREFGLSSLSVDNRTSIVILTFLIGLMGYMSYQSMPKENFPEIVIPTIYIGTTYSGNSPVDMENLVTRPIEKELKGLNGLKDISSTSIQDFSTIIVEFNPNVDISRALQDTKDAVDKAKSELPTDLDADPNVFEVNLSDLPIMFINVSGDYSLDELKVYSEYLQDEIEKLSEISSADIRGAMEREIRIDADLFKMEAVNVSFSDISDAISAENVTISGGNLLAGDFRRSLRIVGEFQSPKEIEDIVVKTDNNKIVYVKDVAEVRDTYEERASYARSSQLPVITIDVVKRSGENLLDAADKVFDIIERAQNTRFPADLDISISNDQSKVTRSQLSNLENSIISGMIGVVVVLMFFLGFRNSLFVGVAIPLSMLMSFLILNALGVTMNLVVLFSLILALGMLVDNGIVVVENIYRLMQEGMNPIDAAKQGVGEVALPIITSTATTLAAFLPLAFWEGIVGEFMGYLPLTLIVVLSSSLFVALVINPVLTSLFMVVQDGKMQVNKKRYWIFSAVGVAIAILFFVMGNITMGNVMALVVILTLANIYFINPAVQVFQNRFLTSLENLYEKTLGFALKGKTPYLLFFGTILLLVLSIGIFVAKSPKVVFFPENDPNYINVFVEKPIGTDIEKTNAFTKTLEEELIEMMEPYGFMLESIIAQVGEGATDPSEGPSQGNSPHKSRITVAFEDFEFRQGVSTTKIMDEIRERMEKYPGATITVDKNRNGPPVGKPINMEVIGEDLEKLIELTAAVRTEINNSSILGIEELKTDIELGKPELLIKIDRDKARRFGLSTNQISNELRTALFGQEVSKFKDGEDEYPIQLRLKDEQRYDIGSLMDKKITFRDKFGNEKKVPISAVADVEYSETYGSVKRKDSDRVITMFSNVRDGYNANEINEQLKDLIADYDMPEGYSVRFTGEQEEQQEAAEFLGRAMLIAVFTIFMIIVAQFNSVATPFIILASVILSTIGVFLGLVAFNMDFVVVMTGVGIISLAGVVVNNAIVLLDYTNLLRQRKRAELGVADGELLPQKELLKTIILGGKIRLRPVLLTAITTVVGLIPLALGVNINFAKLLSSYDAEFYFGGDNAIFWGPMAWTVIFGLIFSTFLTLILVPIMYYMVDKIKSRVAKMKQKA